MCFPVPDVYRRPVCRLVYSEVKLTLFTKYRIPLKIGTLLFFLEGGKLYKKNCGVKYDRNTNFTHMATDKKQPVIISNNSVST